MKKESVKKASQEKESWVCPTLEPMGALLDVVQGGGKVGSNADMDPQASFKGGSG